MKLVLKNIGVCLLLISIVLFCNTNLYAQDTLALTQLEKYFNQARKLSNQDQIKPALEVLEKASKEAEKNDNLKGLIDTYHKFALVNLKIDKEDDALFYSDRAKTLLNSIEYPFGNAVHKFIEGKIEFRNKKSFQARYILDEAKKLNNDRNLYNNILLVEGSIFLEQTKYEDAEKNFNSLLINTDQYEREYLTTKAHLGLTKLYATLQDYEQSAAHGEKALALAEKHHFFKEVLLAYELLSTTYDKLNDYKKALAKNKSLLTIKDTLFNIEKTKNESKTGEKFARNFMVSEVKRQDTEIEELKASQNRSEITAILTSAFLTIISLLAVSLYRNNQIKLKTNDLLQTKNKELQSARDEAVMAMEAKSNFLSTVSHELRTPLYAVTGLTHLLLEENPNPNQKEHLKALKFSGDYLLNFINDILQINKIDADKLELQFSEFRLEKTLKEVIDTLHQSATANNTKLTLNFDENIPTVLMGDSMKLSQILINLIGNAIKFTKNGEVKLNTKLIKKVDNDISLFFEVEDNGIGISKENQENIFDGFEQGSIQINREYGGTGLGLTIVKSLLGLFGTKIQLRSELGKGSSFFFELLLKTKDNVIDDITFEVTPQEHDLTGLHLLIVEDNKINQVITKKMLTKKDITSDIANNGYEAVELAEKNRYDAILMDIHMPGISGDEATIEIRKFNKEVPIIALTAISLDDSLEVFYAAGCDDVVTKPFKPEIFYQKIGENIYNKKHKKPVS